MSNRPVFLIWVKFEIKNKKRLALSLPLSLFSFFMLFDILDDLLSFVNLLSFNGLSKTPDGKFRYLMKSVRICCYVSKEIIIKAGPMELVDIDVGSDKGRVKISMRLL